MLLALVWLLIQTTTFCLSRQYTQSILVVSFFFRASCIYIYISTLCQWLRMLVIYWYLLYTCVAFYVNDKRKIGKEKNVFFCLYLFCTTRRCMFVLWEKMSNDNYHDQSSNCEVDFNSQSEWVINNHLMKKKKKFLSNV